MADSDLPLSSEEQNIVAPLYDETEEAAALSATISNLCKSVYKFNRNLYRYLLGIVMLGIAVAVARTLPSSKPSPVTLWPLLATVLLTKIYVGGRAARLSAVIAILIVLGITASEVAPEVDWEDVCQIVWGLGWSAVIWGIAVLSGSRAKSGNDRFFKRL